ncbi:hypothetical protein KFZ58_14730 [Virgibacillus sp. NKC19-16]|uniref:hypothetical protein n=1 Tax=Virgibacillus salidurans TaxID=2831673 RepID=UPI001F2F0D3C|nr:hypothetical protein [Virgibacillus sp. NKC19-16]UJL45635.1 hypothetical protein KFZ58_14730 [Virgibacillus sp. NKC19-16]
MLNFPKISEVRFTKLIIHSIFAVVALSILTFLSKDIVGLALGHPIEKDISYVSTILLVIWLLFAIQRDKYQKTI